VLGAGASVPFGFPTGIELSILIVNSVDPARQIRNRSRHIYDALKTYLGIPDDRIADFRNAFFNSGKNSIDAFLEHRPEFMDAGKAAIAAALIWYEQPDRIMEFRADNWLRYTFNQISSSLEEFRRNTLSIITFNYNRCVEWFFFNCLRNSYGRAPEECLEALSSIPIIHLHGRLGFLPWESPEGRPFDNKIEEEGLRRSISQIKIIHEDISDGRDADFVTAKEILRSAERIYSMGFGFNKTNVDRLGIVDLDPNKCLATALGLSAQ